MTPSLLILIVTVGISIWAFRDRDVLHKMLLLPKNVVHNKEWYRIFTHAFIHADTMHLLFNAIALWSFGAVLNQYFALITSMPELHFYTMYFGAIVFSSLPDIIKYKNDAGYASLGASGAVSAVVFAAIFFSPWSIIYIYMIPIPGIIFGVLYLWYSSYMAGKANNDRVNHNAHLYGALFGFLYPLIIDPSTIKIFINALMHPTFMQ